MRPAAPETFAFADAALKAPSALAPLAPQDAGGLLRAVSYNEEDLHRLAAGFEPALPRRLVSADGDSAMFSPAWNPAVPSTGGMAYCIYRLPLADYGETVHEQTVGFSWTAPPANATDYWVGYGNQEADSWDWYGGPDDGVLTIESYTPYEDAGGKVLMALVVLGESTCVLDSFTVGAWETRATGADIDLPDDAVEPMPALWKELNPLSCVDLSPDCSPIHDQGSIPACAAMAAGDGAYNYELRQVYGPSGWKFSKYNNRISPRWIYVWTGIDQGQGCPGGIRDPRKTIIWMEEHGCTTKWQVPFGTPSQSCFDCSTEFPAQAYFDSDRLRPDGHVIFASKHPNTGNWYFTAQDIEDVKTVLRVLRHPLVFATPLDGHISEPDYASGEVWTYNGNNHGGHTLLLVGYDDALGATGAFKFRNSWGGDWGDNGYGWISYESLMRDDTKNFAYYIWENYDPAVAYIYGDDTAPVYPPPDFRAVDPNPFTVVLSWQAVPEAVRYNIYRDLQENHIGTVTGETTYTDDTVADGLAHVYWAKATNGVDTSDFGAPAIGYLTAE